MTVAPFDHAFLSGLLGDPEISEAFSLENDLAAMIRFEAALAEVEGEAGVIPVEAARRIVEVCSSFSPDIGELRTCTQRDGVVVPNFVQQLRAAVAEPHARYVHFGPTSQDLIDTSLVLRLKPLFEIFRNRLRGIGDGFDGLNKAFGDCPLTGRTRMRSAVPMRVSDRIRNWAEPLAGHMERIDRLAPNLLKLQFGGAVGTLSDLGDRAGIVKTALASRLSLEDAPASWHVQRTHLGDFGSMLSEITVTFGKFGADICLMAQDEIDTVRLSEGGLSSAMPHKRNPIAAETLVTLARYNAAQLGGLHQALVHEQERSGAMWTLEWMILPSMVVATGAALATVTRLIGSIESLGDPGSGPS